MTFESRFSEAVTRPTTCPYCLGKRLDTIAKTITVRTLWRCRECEETLTIASRASLARYVQASASVASPHPDTEIMRVRPLALGDLPYGS